MTRAVQCHSPRQELKARQNLWLEKRQFKVTPQIHKLIYLTSQRMNGEREGVKQPGVTAMKKHQILKLLVATKIILSFLVGPLSVVSMSFSE